MPGGQTMNAQNLSKQIEGYTADAMREVERLDAAKFTGKIAPAESALNALVDAFVAQCDFNTAVLGALAELKKP